MEGTAEAKPRRGEAGQERWEYAWNDAGLMASATGPELHLEFTYDSFARRLEKRVYRRGTSKLAGLPAPKRGALIRRTRFVWDGDVLVHELREEAAAAGDPIVEERTYWFEDGGFEPWAHREVRRDDVGRERGGWFHYVNDPIGTPERLVDERGEVAAEYRRKAWGELEALPGARATTPVRLQGQYADDETGLSNSYWRYYLADLGSWASADPLLLRGSHHAFAFCGSPFRTLDPFGLAATAWRNGYRTPDGKFASPTGPGRSGQEAVDRVRGDLVGQGWTHLGDEQSFVQPHGRICQGQVRRYDLLMRDPNGEVVGVEVKSGSARPTREQRVFDSRVNAGTRTTGIGQSAGVTLDRTETIFG